MKFLLTYDNSAEVRELYEWAIELSEQEWNYTINRTDDQKNGTNRKGTRYKGKELFILNYDSQAPQSILLPLADHPSAYEASESVS